MSTLVPVRWQPRVYQMPLWNFMEKGGKRAVAIWHRRAGKDTLSLNRTVVSAIERPGIYWHLLPTYNQGRKIVWDGRSKEGRPFLSYWPEDFITSVNHTEMKLELANGSIWQVVGTDNVDRLVGANPIGCVFSEYSLQDPKAWDYVRPILAENDGWAMFIYTPRGKNHGYKLAEMAKKNPQWFYEVLDVETTGAIPLSAIQDERDAGMPEETIQQEFYCSFLASTMGAYYSQQMALAQAEGRILTIPWEPRLPVNTAWDLGMSDQTAIWFHQQAGRENWLIDYYANSGEGISHYAKVLKERPYVYGKHFGPHDIKVRELGTGRSRFETAWKLGVRFTQVKNLPIEDGIEAVRGFLPSCYFDERKTDRGLESLRQYRKEWDESNLIFKNKPVHDWTSHAADAFRYLALGLRQNGLISGRQLPTHADGDYDMLSY